VDPAGHARWERLWERHADSVLAYARRRIDAEDAPDVVAETFLAAWRRIDEVPQDAVPWLYGVARNVIENSRRATRRRDALRTRLASVRAAGPGGDPAPEVDARTDMVAALQRLPPAEREALTLVAWEDLDIRRGAAALGCSPGTFAVRVHRGRRRLKRILAADMDEWAASTEPPLEEAAGGART
jgi:RNA polymerase sigma-70 factor, ECF subfamily